MIETGIDFQALSRHGIVAPAGTPAAVVDKLDTAFSAALASPDVKQQLAQEGAVPAKRSAPARGGRLARFGLESAELSARRAAFAAGEVARS